MLHLTNNTNEQTKWDKLNMIFTVFGGPVGYNTVTNIEVIYSLK